MCHQRPHDTKNTAGVEPLPQQIWRLACQMDNCAQRGPGLDKCLSVHLVATLIEKELCFGESNYPCLIISKYLFIKVRFIVVYFSFSMQCLVFMGKYVVPSPLVQCHKHCQQAFKIE